MKKELKNQGCPLNREFLYCMEGQVLLPLFKMPPSLLEELTQIQSYNIVLAMISTGGNVDKNINDGGGPYIFRVNGQTHHKIGTLHPINDSNPQFAYVLNHNTSNKNIESSILTALVQILNEMNGLVKGLRMIAAIIIGDIGNIEDAHRDIVVQYKGGGLKMINELHPSYMALQYPLLFPYEEDGFMLGILRRTDHRKNCITFKFTRSPRYMVENYQDVKAICSPRQKAKDQPDTVIRVFKIKLNQLLHDLKHGQHLGRGLPHAHILLFLHYDDKHPTQTEIDRKISVKIPGVNEDPNICCMINNKYSKIFSNKFNRETSIDEDGFAVYRRRDDLGMYIEMNGVKLDNRFIVPYNMNLLVKYQAHINVEWCNRSISIKYLFKYKNKGPDRAIVILEENLHINDCRYVSATEACWRIFRFDIHYCEPAVERLSFHLENEHSNAMYEEARNLTYSSSPSEWVCNNGDKEWNLTKTIDNILYPYLKSTCYALGLLDDKEWHEALNHASQWASGKQLRELFLLVRNGRLLREFENMVYLDVLLIGENNNRLLQEELDCNRVGLNEEHYKRIYDSVIESVNDRELVLAVASFGVAALLLLGGQIAHSRFQIPINVSNNSTCLFKQSSQVGELMVRTSLKIWDEAPMAHRNCFEAMDCSLRDILQFTNLNNVEKPFGGKLDQDMGDIATRDFAHWILSIADNDLSCVESRGMIAIPPDLIVQSNNHPIGNIVNAAYPNLIGKSPTNDFVQDINDYMIDQLIDLDEQVFFNADSICKARDNITDQQTMFPVELLNSLEFPDIPNNGLRLKSNGHCNGTRLIVTRLSKWIVGARIMTGMHVGEKVSISHIILSPSDSKLYFIMKRRQFPISKCFAMIINKSQGETLESVGLFLEKPVLVMVYYMSQSLELREEND
ncbi:hypothetical protein I3843_Q045000 [Carya illinoinensis]|nr:hypothetical protein I3843_Q045000 [Carya illinoinensis]